MPPNAISFVKLKEEDRELKEYLKLRRVYLQKEHEFLFSRLLNSLCSERERQLYRCRCGHYFFNHVNNKGKCLMPHCSMLCYFFIPKHKLTITFNLTKPIKDSKFWKQAELNIISRKDRGY